jgi:tol-pal system protein YbgF
MRKFIRLALAAAVLAAVSATPMHAANKEMAQLQQQVQDLLTMVQHLQQSNDERMGVIKDLVQQTADSVNKMTLTVNGLQRQMATQAEAAGTKNDQLAGQIQSLNDSLDELKARMQRMEKTLNDVQGQQQQTNATLQNFQPAGGSAAAGGGASAVPPPGSPLPAGDAPVAKSGKAAAVPPPSAGPSSGELYRNAYSDFMAGKNNVAASEFSDLIKAYPDDNLSGNAYFYLGEMDLRAEKSTNAIKNYDHVLEHYPNNAKVPAAHLHKAQALVAQNQKTAAIAELKALINRFPTSPEAATARTRLAALQARR